MEFIGKGNLIGNIYDTIILEEDNDNCLLKCNAISKKKLNYLDYNVVGNFRSSLDSIDSDYDKALAVIDYFTDYNEISYIYDNVKVIGLNGRFIKAGNGDRQLLVKLNEFNEIIYNKIFNKYVFSLYKYIYDLINNNNIDAINFVRSDCCNEYIMSDNSVNILEVRYVGKIPDYIIRIINDVLSNSKSISFNYDFVYNVELDNVDLYFDNIEDFNNVIPFVFDNISIKLNNIKEDAKQLVFLRD